MTPPASVEGHRARLRDKFLEFGLDKFTDAETLELLLTLATPRQDCKLRARELLHIFGGLSRVLEAEPALLAQVPGIGPKNILGIKLVPAVAERYLADRLKSASIQDQALQVHEYLAFSMQTLEREVFRVIFLNGRHQVCGIEDMFSGTLHQTPVFPREILSAAFRRNATGLVCAHNHPMENQQPSQEDFRLTRRLYHACRNADLEFVDHFIISQWGSYSFAQQGHMRTLAMEYAALGL